MVDDILLNLRKAYDRMVDERDGKQVMDWKKGECESFLSLLRSENKNRFLEIGAGTGVHGKFFQDEGMAVVCTDLSPEMVKRCSEKGLEAYEMDFLNIDFPANSFEAVFAMNCLLHVPRGTLPKILSNLQGLLEKNGLFYWGQYGGVEQEGTYEDDHYRPKRFFSFISDDQLKAVVQEYFEIVEFKKIKLGEEDDFHFQALVLRKE